MYVPSQEHKAGGPALSVLDGGPGQKNHISSHIMLRLPSDACTSARPWNGQHIYINPFSPWQYPEPHFHRRVSIPRTVPSRLALGCAGYGLDGTNLNDGQTHFVATAHCQSCKVDDQDGQDRQG